MEYRAGRSWSLPNVVQPFCFTEESESLRGEVTYKGQRSDNESGL